MPSPMTRRRLLAIVVPVLALVAIAAAMGGTRPTLPPPARFEVQRLADGVYAVVRREPPSLYFESNSVFIIGDSDVIVVDAQFSLETTREVLVALRTLTDKPVRWVINTHGHDDHVTGNQVYRDSFPGVEFIAQRATRDSMVIAGPAKRDAFLRSLPGTIAFFHRSLSEGKGPDGAPITAEERAGFASDSAIGARFLAEASGLESVPATRVVEERLVLHQGARTVEILWLGLGHSAGDLVVNLPAERIVVAGDLVVAPVPLVGSTSHPAAFGRTLARLRALRPAVIVPGHGPVQRDDRHVAEVQRMLESIAAQVAAAVSRGDSLPAARQSVRLDEFRERFAGDSKLQRFVFENYVSIPAVAAAFADASAASDRPTPRTQTPGGTPTMRRKNRVR